MRKILVALILAALSCLSWWAVACGAENSPLPSVAIAYTTNTWGVTQPVHA